MTRPSEMVKHYVEVFYQSGDPPFIYGLSGLFTKESIEDIEKDLIENPDEYFHHNGTYLFQAVYVDNHPEDGGPHFELEQVEFHKEPTQQEQQS